MFAGVVCVCVFWLFGSVFVGVMFVCVACCVVVSVGVVWVCFNVMFQCMLVYCLCAFCIWLSFCYCVCVRVLFVVSALTGWLLLCVLCYVLRLVVLFVCVVVIVCMFAGLLVARAWCLLLFVVLLCWCAMHCCVYAGWCVGCVWFVFWFEPG